MATRSMIGIERKDGTVEGIYCHYDGYLDHNGRILKQNYTTPEKVSDLISLGAIRTLGRNLPPYDDETNTDPFVAEGETPEIETYSNRDSFLELSGIGGIEYTYLFTIDGEWLYVGRDSDYSVEPVPEFDEEAVV